MKKEYGLAQVAGMEDNFEVLIEYKCGLRNSKYGKKPYIYGKDMITGTRVIEAYPHHFYDLNSAIKSGIYKRNSILVKSCNSLSKEEVINKLRNMTNKDLVEYCKKIDKVKDICLDTKVDMDLAYRNNLRLEKTIETEKKIIKKMIKYKPHYNDYY